MPRVQGTWAGALTSLRRAVSLTAASILLAALAPAVSRAGFDEEVRPGEGADDVATGAGGDLLAGGEGQDQLGGGRGGDLIVDLAGDDVVRAGAGDDRITVRDLVGRDRVRCGGGRDLAIADDEDDVAADCEDVLGSGGRERVRRDARSLNGDAKRRFVAAIKELKRTPSPFSDGVGWYDQFVDWHEDVFDSERVGAHGGPGFLPWHRGFLMLYEDALSLVAGRQVSIPYWDWTKRNSTSTVFSPRLMGGNGDPSEGYAVTDGPFRRGEWRLRVRDDGGTDSFVPDIPPPEEGRYVERWFGSSPGTALPNAATQRAFLGIGRYDAPRWDSEVLAIDSFRNALEGGQALPSTSASHNTVHVWTGGVFDKGEETQGGTMALATSPNDPVFWLHHNNIDRVWEAWLRANGRAYRPVNKGPRSQRRDAVLRPYARYGIEFTPGRLLRAGRLGYRYAHLPPAAAQSRSDAAAGQRWMRCTIGR